jgi:hypothetical protein
MTFRVDSSVLHDILSHRICDVEQHSADPAGDEPM